MVETKEATKEDIKDMLKPWDVLLHYGAKKPKSIGQNGECPFHASKHKSSLVVNEELGLAWCCSPGCPLNENGGDIFNQIAVGENKDIKTDFPDVLKKSAEIAGVKLKDIDTNEISKTQIMQQGLDVFYNYTKLYKNNIKDYVLKKRNITESDFNKINIGYFPPDDWLKFKIEFLKKVPDANKISFIDPNGKEKKFVNTFFPYQGRITHPHYYGHNLISITGEETPETVFKNGDKYHKLKKEFCPTGKAEPYYINNVNNTDYVIIAEGFWDTIKLQLLGLPVISYGTCKPPKEFAQRYKTELQDKKIIISFDDEDNGAGAEGTLSLGKQLIANKIENVHVLELNKGDEEKIDIDELITEISEEKSKEIKELFQTKTKSFQKYLQEHDAEYAIFDYKTDHLPLFNEYEKIIGLVGDEYKPLIKLNYYNNVGLTQKDSPIQIGSVHTDTRIPIGVVMSSGKGKNNCKQTNKKTIPSTFVESEAVSAHPEQMIGKIVSNGAGKNKKIKKVFGYFADDLLQIDEGRKLFVQDDAQTDQLRQYMCIALDPMGRNFIQKRMTEFGAENQLEYMAKCNIVLYSQPCKIIAKVTEGGLLRRLFLIKITSMNDPLKKYLDRLSNNFTDQELSSFNDMLNNLVKKNNESWDFEEGLTQVLGKYANLLFDFGCSHSEKGAKFMRLILEQYILDILLKFSGIVALFSNSKKITAKHVQIAYTDCLEFLNIHLNCIKDFCEDFYNFDIKPDEAIPLEWLQEENATSEQASCTSIAALRGFICDYFNISKSGAKKRYDTLVHKKFIKSIQSSSYETKVWITPLGKKAISGIVRKRPSKSNWYKEYQSIVKGDEK